VKHPQAFGDLLTRAVYRIATETRRTIGAVQDDLGYAIGRTAAGSPIEYWRKGYVPAQSTEVERLADALYRRGGLRDQGEVETFLRYADHPDLAGCCVRILHPEPADDPPPVTSTAARVTLVIEGDIAAFQTHAREQIITHIADLVGLPPDQIVIAQVVAGSVRLTLELPTRAAVMLRDRDAGDALALKELGIMQIEWEPTADQMAAAVLARLQEVTFLEAVNMRMNGAVARLWHLVTEGLARLADPLLPAPAPSDLDDAPRQAALQAYLEVRMERDPAMRNEVAALLATTDPTAAVWSPVQRMALLVRQITRATSMQMGAAPGALTPVLHDYIRHQADPWQVDLPRRWWRPPWQRWLYARGDQIWHVRIAHALALALLRIDALQWQEPALFFTALQAAGPALLARGRVPVRDRSAFLAALRDTRLQVQVLVRTLRPQFQVTAPSAAPATSFRITRRQGGVELAVASGPERQFHLTVPIPPTPALAVLSGHDSLFSDHLPEVAQSPMVSVTLREVEPARLTLLVGVSETDPAVRWQVDLLEDEQLLASVTTSQVGIAQFNDLPRTLIERRQIRLRCRELLLPEQNQHQEQE
jgi:hypothetical protein